MQEMPLAHRSGAVVAHLDIPTRKGAEEALQEANRCYDVFLSLAGHELRTPPSGIRGCIQLVLHRLEKCL